MSDVINGSSNGVVAKNGRYGGENLLYDQSVLLTAVEKGFDSATASPNLVALVSGRSLLKPGENLKLRPLSDRDYQRGFMDLLCQLTKVGEVSASDFLKRFHSMKACSGSYYVSVIEDTARDRVIGTATLVLEQKFIRSCGTRGIIEDVVVSEGYRGQQLGKVLIAAKVLLAQSILPYKITLTCNETTKSFYTQLGFACEEGSGINMTCRM